MALEQIRWACEAGLPRGVVLADAAYGVEADFRNEITRLELKYALGVKTTTTVWAPGMSTSTPPTARPGRGRPRTRPLIDDANKPISVEQLARNLPMSAWQNISWREGTNDRLSSRFARVRIRSAHDRSVATEKISEEWLVIEWPDDEDETMKFWFSTLDKTVTFAHLVHTIKMRWRIERDYLELKQEVGLGHFEGRGWRGFHHHATLCIAAYAFLVSERAAFSPSEAACGRLFEIPALPQDYRPRGAASPH